jgi:hypothetical protein
MPAASRNRSSGTTDRSAPAAAGLKNADPLPSTNATQTITQKTGSSASHTSAAARTTSAAIITRRRS